MPITGVSPVIAAIYRTGVGHSIANASNTLVDFETKLSDTHNAVTIGAAWKFTAPQSGFYLVTVQALFTATTTWADTEYGAVNIYVNGNAIRFVDRVTGYGGGASVYRNLNGAGLFYLNAGDYLDVRLYQNSGAALALRVYPAYNWVSIMKFAGG